MKKHLPNREQNSNKGTFGTVLNVSGSKTYFGAAILSSLAALRVGVGKVNLCSTKNTLLAASFNSPELVLSERKNINFDGINAIILGCGLGLSNADIDIFNKVISNTKDIPIIIDADGLNILSNGNYTLPENTVLTPHPKEMSRLMKISTDEVLADPKNITEACVDKYSATVVLKMHRTIVVSKTKEIYHNTTGNSALAKAGSGDVLAGMIGGFLAQRLSCFDAACLGVYLHGLAGELASSELSEYSVISTDLLKYIGYAFKKILD